MANYPFCTIDSNVGIVKVPDDRLQKLADFFQSQKIIPTIIEFVDIAGLVRGANKGEGLGNQFLANIREVDAIVQVVRCFENKNIMHVDESVDPMRDIETVNTELLLKDIETVTRRLGTIEKDVRAEKKGSAKFQANLQGLLRAMNQEIPARQFLKEHPDSSEAIEELFLLSAKPIVYLLNADSEKDAKPAKDKAKELGASYTVMNIKEEYDIADLTTEEISDLGVGPPQLVELIKKAYQVLDLITFFTTGPDETRAWTLVKGEKAPDAGGVIHSDFKDKFMRDTLRPTRFAGR